MSVMAWVVKGFWEAASSSSTTALFVLPESTGQLYPYYAVALVPSTAAQQIGC